VAEDSEVHFVPAIGGGASTLEGRPPARLTDPDHPLTMSLA
jgi:hypothetical protein